MRVGDCADACTEAKKTVAEKHTNAMQIIVPRLANANGACVEA